MKMKFTIDADFLNRLRTREKKALQQFVDEHSGALYLVLIFLLDDAVHAEMIPPKIFQTAINNIEAYSPEKESFIIWLFRNAIPFLDLDRDTIIEKINLLIKANQ